MPLADLLFVIAMARVLKTVRQALDEAKLTTRVVPPGKRVTCSQRQRTSQSLGVTR